MISLSYTCCASKSYRFLDNIFLGWLIITNKYINKLKRLNDLNGIWRMNCVKPINIICSFISILAFPTQAVIAHSDVTTSSMGLMHNVF